MKERFSETITSTQMEIKSNELITVADSVLFEEVAKRLKRIYRKGHGIDFLYGCFEFIFHEGRFQGVEEKPRFRFYRSREGIAAV